MSVRRINVQGFYPSQNVTDVFVVDELLDDEQCSQFRTLLNRAPKTLRVDDRFRNNDRITLNEPDLAAELFRKIEERVPNLHRELDFKPIGCNPRFHVYSYNKRGDQFTLHADQPYIIDETISFYTVLVYLSDEYEGGEALIGGSEKFKPERGTAIIFPHYILHGAAPLISGTRYTLRTDIMYQSNKLTHVHNLGREEVLP